MRTTAGGSSVADSLRDAKVALRTAWYDAALELLEGCEDWSAEFAEEAIVLKADVLGRRDPVAAVEYLTTVEDIPASPAGRFSFALAFGKMHASTRDYDAAQSRYLDAEALVGEAPGGAGLLAYHRLRMAAYQRNTGWLADPSLALAINHPDPSIAAASLGHKAWLHLYAEDYGAYVSNLRRAVAFATVATPEPVDVQALAASIYSLVQMAFETADEAAMADGRAAFDALQWTPDVRHHHFAAARALGWDAFMRGQSGRAQWAFKDARALAPSAAWRAMSHLDRAYVARIAGNEIWAIEELAEADRIARDVQWEQCIADDQRQILVILAVLHAPVDAVRAQRYAAMYAQVGTENVHPRFSAEGDRRAYAHVKYAQARIDQTLGRREAAVASLSEAYQIFEGAQYHYRCVLAATALAELTGEQHWNERATHHASFYPDCPLAGAADEALRREDAMPAQLSPMQRQIAKALWAGVDHEELSRRFSRSLYTIEKQVSAVYAAFGVQTRGQLLEEARRRHLA